MAEYSHYDGHEHRWKVSKTYRLPDKPNDVIITETCELCGLQQSYSEKRPQFQTREIAQ